MYIAYVIVWLEGLNLAESNIFFQIYLYFSLASPYPIYLLSFLNYYFRLVKLQLIRC